MCVYSYKYYENKNRHIYIYKKWYVYLVIYV